MKGPFVGAVIGEDRRIYFLLSDPHQHSQHTAGNLSIINSVSFYSKSRGSNSQRALQ